MFSVMIFLHVISALLLGVYVVFPFVAGRSASLSGAGQESFVGLLSFFNRIGQFALIVSFITGGAMIHSAGVSVPWMIISVVLLLIIGAVTGMLGSRMKKLVAAAKAGTSVVSDAAKIRAYSWIAAISVIVAVFFMLNRSIV